MGNEQNRSAAFIVVAFIIAASVIASTWIATKGLVEVKGNNTITVTGSAKKQIVSDLIVWRGSFSAQNASMADAYAELDMDLDKVKGYLKGKGLTDKDIVVSAISTMNIYEIMPNGMQTSNIVGYRLDQTVEISSKEVDKITGISRESTELINEGVEFTSQFPQYYYTKIADMKVSMLAEATKDAKMRAQQISENTGSTIGKLRTAKMGVFQITPLYSTDVADYGINDTSSLDKEITAVVTCSFELK